MEMPIISEEYGTRLNDPDLLACLREAYAEVLPPDDLLPNGMPGVDFDAMSELEQIEAQLEWVCSDNPPFPGENEELFAARIKAGALKLYQMIHPE